MGTSPMRGLITDPSKWAIGDCWHRPPLQREDDTAYTQTHSVHNCLFEVPARLDAEQERDVMYALVPVPENDW
jgi:hypothetical protein